MSSRSELAESVSTIIGSGGRSSTLDGSVTSLNSSQPTSPGASSPSSILDTGSHKDRKSALGYRFATQCATVDDPNHKDQYGASSAPIYMSATFKGLPGAEFDYSRSGNPTRSMLQHHLCQLQGCAYSFVVSSGMACLDVITRLLKPGERIIAGDDLYGGTNRLLGYLNSHGGIETDHIDTTDASKVEEILEKRAQDFALGVCGPVKMVLLETPTNPLLKICDLERCARAAKRLAPDAVVVVDNTMMSPYLQRPLELGVDVVYDSGTKYLSGHHDLMAGVIACDREDIGKQIAFTINSVGNALTPFDSFLLLRGIKTLAVRMDRQQESSMQVARYLDNLGFKVNYPGLPNHPSKDVHDRQAAGPGAVLSFETGDKALSEKIVGATRLWGISVSFGCVNSLISMPCLMSHASIDPALRAARRLPEDLIRLCVGIEDPRDLLEDLEAALLEAGAIRPKRVNLNAEHSAADVSVFGEYERVPLPSETDAKVADLTSGLDRAKVETRGGDNEKGSLIVSAPGKVILFGEHAVVHGVTAVAAAVALRFYGHVTPRADGRVSFALPDLSVEHTWDVAALPWDSVPAVKDGEAVVAPVALNETLVKAIEKVVGTVANENERSHAASVAFLYLYMSLAGPSAKSGQAFVLRSALPIGAGLGSSAALSSCLASALVYTHGHLPMPAHSHAPSASHPSHNGRRSVSSDHATLINAWAFLAEKVMHGNPSGVDNSVAVHGGALAFTRANPAVGRPENTLEQLRGFASVRFLLTDTRIGRDTKSLVASVGAQKEAEPERVGKTLAAIQDISDEARASLSDAELPRSQLLRALEALIKENHEHLASLKVSHPALEAIRAKTGAAPWRLATKLTGAGGGGCAVTLIPDDFPAHQLAELKAALLHDGFQPYETRVGGSGLGVLQPSLREASADQATSGEDGSAVAVPDRARFEQAEAHELAEWAEKAGQWAYV